MTMRKKVFSLLSLSLLVMMLTSNLSYGADSICAFGNATEPRAPRESDFTMTTPGQVVNQSAVAVQDRQGASTFLESKINIAPLSGHYYCIDSAKVTDKIGYSADGIDAILTSPRPDGHGTIYPKEDMAFADFKNYFNALPWIHKGNKPKP